MKITLLSILLIFGLSYNSYCQQLKLEELISIYDKDLEVDEINDFITTKGWIYSGAEAESEELAGRITWGYNLSYTKEQASAWLAILTLDNERVCVQYQAKPDIISQLKKRVIELNLKKLDSGIDEVGTIYSVYIGKNYGIRFRISKDGTNTATIYPKSYFTKEV